jgi:transcription antitermination factor NusG
METTKKWFAVYTKPRWEKKVHRSLSEKELESYCPLNKVSKQWTDRVKVVEEPLFKSYVFVRIAEDELTRVRMVGGVLNFVYWNGKPAVVRDSEIEDIRRFLMENSDVQLVPLDLEPESKVLIRGGVMMDRMATVKRVLHNKVEVVIESLGYKLVAFMNRSNLQPIS